MNKERFFGLHFDFHAVNEIEVGTRTNKEDIKWFIEQTNPDFVQCDCKGHAGNSSYPTKVGHPVEKLKEDNLRIWCETLKEHNIPVFVHYSGVLDKWYAEHNPENAAVYKEGNPEGAVSLFGDYCDECLIPQLKELIEEYGIDGAWIDGEEWAVQCDYSDKAKAVYENLSEEEYRDVMRKAFYDYVKKYVDAVHEAKPDFKITSNWIYTAQAPDKPEVNVDFISGDFENNNSVHAARFDTRCIANQGKPWDLMAWTFFCDYQGCFAEKSAAALMQEAAMVLSQGGGFQMYIRQNKDGSAKRIRNDKFRQISDFVHARKINFGKKTKAQIGVYFSTHSAYKEKVGCKVFQPEISALKGTVDCVLDTQYTAGVILQHQWETFDDYEVIIVPEWKFLTDEEISRLTDYASRGGKLVVVGSQLAVKIGGFNGKDIQCDVIKAIKDDQGNFIKFKSDFINLGEGSGMIYSRIDLRDDEMAAFKTVAKEKGSITYIPFDFGKLYSKNKNFIFENYMKTVLNSLSKPIISINKKQIDISVQQDGETMLINLVNMRQSRHSLEYTVYEEVPTVFDVEISFDEKYDSVTMPFGEEFSVKTVNGKTVVNLKKLEIHSIIKLN